MLLFLVRYTYHSMRSSGKATLWLVVGVIGLIGGYVPVWLWHSNPLGIESVLGGMIGGFVGIALWYRYLRS